MTWGWEWRKLGFYWRLYYTAEKKWKKTPKVYKNEAESLPQWELDSERVQRFDFAEVLDWISVRINQGRDDYILQELLKVVSVILNQNIPFSKPKRAISPLQPLETSLLSACLEDLEVHVCSWEPLQVLGGLQWSVFYWAVGVWPSWHSYGASFCQVWREGSAGDHFLQFYLWAVASGVGLSTGISSTLLILCRETTLYSFAALPNKFW